jgi:hypothetical protein
LDDLTPQEIENLEKQLTATLKKVEAQLEQIQAQPQVQETQA